MSAKKPSLPLEQKERVARNTQEYERLIADIKRDLFGKPKE